MDGVICVEYQEGNGHSPELMPSLEWYSWQSDGRNSSQFGIWFKLDRKLVERLLEADHLRGWAEALEAGAFFFQHSKTLLDNRIAWPSWECYTPPMPASSTVPPREVAAFPSWLDLPPGYIVNDWIIWQKGKLVAARLRENPALVRVALECIKTQPDGMFSGSEEWLVLLQEKKTAEIAAILESPDQEGQRLRSSSPFVREPFIEPEEIETIRERAYLG